MANTTSEALRQKIETRAAAAPISVGGVKRAFRMAVARAGLNFSGMVASLTDYAERELGLDDLLDGLADCPMLMAIRRGEDELGLFLMDVPMIMGLLEHLTTGRVIKGEGEPRPPTRTDAILLSDFANGLLTLIVEEAAELANAPNLGGYRYDRLLADARAAEMALEEGMYQEYTLTIELDGGAKTGTIRMLFPKPNPGSGQAPRRQDWSKAWREQVEKAQVRVEAVLCRTRMSLNQVSNLQVGDLVEVPIERINRVAVIGGNGKIMARGKLGRQGANRAIRIGADGIGQDTPATAPAPGAGAPVGFGAGPGLVGGAGLGGLPGAMSAAAMNTGDAAQPGPVPGILPGPAGADTPPDAPVDAASMAPQPGELEALLSGGAGPGAEPAADDAAPPGQEGGGNLPKPMPMKIAAPEGGS